MSQSIILFGYYGVGNLGDDLLLMTVLRTIPEDFKVKVVVRGTYNLDSFQKIRKFDAVLKISDLGFREAQCVIYGGGGLFPSRKFTTKNLLANLRLVSKGKQCLFDSLGIVPKTSFWSKLRFNFFLSFVNHISVRDEVSREYVEAFGKKVTNCGDLYFSNPSEQMKFSIEAINKITGKTMLVCVANPFSKEELCSTHYLERYGQFLKTISDCIDYCVTQSYTPVFLPFFKGSDDIVIEDLKELNPKLKDYSIIRCGVDFDVSEVDSVFQLFDLGICMRFHSKVLSIKNALPFLGVCYDFKSNSLLTECGINEYSVKYGIRKNQFFGKEIDLKYSEMESRINSVISERGEIISKMNAYTQRVKLVADSNHLQMKKLYVSQDK